MVKNQQPADWISCTSSLSGIARIMWWSRCAEDFLAVDVKVPKRFNNKNVWGASMTDPQRRSLTTNRAAWARFHPLPTHFSSGVAACSPAWWRYPQTRLLVSMSTRHSANLSREDIPLVVLVTTGSTWRWHKLYTIGDVPLEARCQPRTLWCNDTTVIADEATMMMRVNGT